MLKQRLLLQFNLQFAGFGLVPILLHTDATVCRQFVHRKGVGRMKHLDVRHCWFHDNGMSAITSMLGHNISITRLATSDNKITQTGVQSVADMLKVSLLLNPFVSYINVVPAYYFQKMNFLFVIRSMLIYCISIWQTWIWMI